MRSPTIRFYTRTRCPLCEKAKVLLLELQDQYEFFLEIVDIERDDQLTELYGLMIPVVEFDGEVLQYGQIDKHIISKRLQEKLSFL
jgi:glutaredoxin